MKLLLDYKKTLAISILTAFLSLFFLSYKNNSISKTVLISNITQKDSDQLIQVGLDYANGYTGQNSIIISEDSIYYKYNYLKLQYDTATPKELWSKITNAININSFCKIVNGKSEQERDGTDTIYFIRTKLKKYYSITNGHGKEFDEQKEFLSLLTEQFPIYFAKAVKHRGEKAYR